MQTIPVVLNSGLSVKVKSLPSQYNKKNMLQKGPETEKKSFAYRVGLNPQLRWLTSVCLRGFDRNVQQLFNIFPLSISNQHIQVPGGRASSLVLMRACNAK